MNPILTQQLIARHPALLSMPKRSVIAQRGVECGDGWHRIIDDMLTEIARHIVLQSAPARPLFYRSRRSSTCCGSTPSHRTTRPGDSNSAEQKSQTSCEQRGGDWQLVANPFPRVTCES